MYNNAFRLDRMNTNLEQAKSCPGNESIQYQQLRMIMHDARTCGIPIIDWLFQQVKPAAITTEPANHTQITSAEFSCTQCNANFKTKAALNGHQRVHKKGGTSND
jgi:hypothetical protein